MFKLLIALCATLSLARVGHDEKEEHMHDVIHNLESVFEKHMPKSPVVFLKKMQDIIDPLISKNCDGVREELRVWYNHVKDMMKAVTELAVEILGQSANAAMKPMGDMVIQTAFSYLTQGFEVVIGSEELCNGIELIPESTSKELLPVGKDFLKAWEHRDNCDQLKTKAREAYTHLDKLLEYGSNNAVDFFLGASSHKPMVETLLNLGIKQAQELVHGVVDNQLCSTAYSIHDHEEL